MRVELKQWLRSHWGEMSVKRSREVSNQPVPESGRRWNHQHARSDTTLASNLMMVSGFVLLIVCRQCANLNACPRHGAATTNIVEYGAGCPDFPSCAAALTESILLSLLARARCWASHFLGTRVILHFAFPSNAGFATVPISASPSVPIPTIRIYQHRCSPDLSSASLLHDGYASGSD